MSDIFSQSISPIFKKQSVEDYFVQPMFVPDDLRNIITVRTDIKGTELLNRVSAPSMLTKPKNSAGFNAGGSFALTNQEITVKPMAMEFEQNARAFWGSIVQEMLAQGFAQDDVEQMKSPDVWNKIMLPLIAKAGRQDLFRQMFFGSPVAETFSIGLPTGTLDTNYTGYTGFFTNFVNDLFAGTIPSNQHVPIASSAAKAKQEVVYTYTAGTDSQIIISINGLTYIQPYATSATITCNNWLTTHKANIEARCPYNGVIVTNPSAGVIKIVSRLKGSAFFASATVTGTGSFAVSGIVAVVKASTMASNEADITLETMLDLMTPEMQDFDLVFMMTSSVWRNLVHTIKDRSSVLGDEVILNGIKVPTYEGFPIIVRPDWDKWIAAGQVGVNPHRVVLTTPKNLLFATDGTSDSDMIETWYNQEAQMRRYRVQYKAQTAYFHKELLILAGFTD